MSKAAKLMSKTFEEIVRERKSIRSFNSKSIPDEILEKICSYAILCPSAAGKESYHAYVVRNKETIKQLAIDAMNQDWIEEAPCVFVFCCECKKHVYGKRGVDLYSLQDSDILQTYTMLACQNEGLKTCWVGGFDEDDVRKTLNIPAHYRPVGMMPCGYSDYVPRHKQLRNPVGESFEFC